MRITVADFLSGDAFGSDITFAGKRIKRGLYLSGTGVLLNADCNGALNILRKNEAKINLLPQGSFSFGKAEIHLLCKEYISPRRLKVA